MHLPGARARDAALLAAVALGMLVLAGAGLVAHDAAAAGTDAVRPARVAATLSVLAPSNFGGLPACDIKPVAMLRGGERTCFETSVEQLMRRDAETALAALRVTAVNSDWFSEHCHIIMHRQGREHARDVRLSSVLEMASDTCVDGFLHGMVEEALASPESLTPELAARTCITPTSTLLAQSNCEHGLGHALMRASDNDLPGALGHCLDIDPRFARNCAGGAFMENEFAARGEDEAGTTRYYDPARPQATCTAIDERLAPTCHAWAVKRLPVDDRRAYCDRLAGDSGPCWRSLGAMRGKGAVECEAVAACWDGLGFAEGLRGQGTAAASCMAAPPATRSVCVEAFASAVSMAGKAGTASAGEDPCEGLGPETQACARGLQQVERPIDFL